MSTGTQTTTHFEGVQDLLTGARFELMPFDSFDEEITYLPPDATIAITTSPKLGLERTIERAELAATQGFDVVPHIAARYVEDRAHADDIAQRLTDVGVTDVFVPGGDRDEPIGEFESAYDLLWTFDDMGYAFDEVGITGYPEGHPFLDDETLATAMDKKEPFATYIVTQMCYDPETVLRWIEMVRDRGIDLPVEIGIPGVMNYQRLIQISQKVGVGDSIEFLRKTTGVLGFLRELIGSRGRYKPDELIDCFAAYVDDDSYDIRGVHIYTLNQTPDTEEWRRDRLAD